MSNLERFDNDGVELVINSVTGESFTTISGYARMSGKSKSTISERLGTVRNEDIETAEILTTQGLRTVRLIPAKLAFKWLMKDNPELAEKMGECGATVYFHRLAGYQVKSTPVESPLLPTTYLEALKALVAVEEAKAELQNKVNTLETICDEIFGFSSIIRVAKINKVSEKLYSCHVLKKAAKELGLDIKKAPCPRYNYKNLYPNQAWQKAYPEAILPTDQNYLPQSK